MTEYPITPPPPHLLKKFSAQARDETKKRNGAGCLKTFATLCIEWAMNSKTTPNDRQIRSSEIEPSPELVEQWVAETWHEGTPVRVAASDLHIATQAARWGADQELEACCEWVSQWCGRWPDGTRPEDALRPARRPKPPSLKEQALEALDQADKGLNESEWQQRSDTIRRALEQLDD